VREPGRRGRGRDGDLVVQAYGQVPVGVSVGGHGHLQQLPQMLIASCAASQVNPQQRREPGHHPGIDRDHAAVVAACVQHRALGRVVSGSVHLRRERRDQVIRRGRGEAESRHASPVDETGQRAQVADACCGQADRADQAGQGLVVQCAERAPAEGVGTGDHVGVGADHGIRDPAAPARYRHAHPPVPHVGRPPPVVVMVGLDSSPDVQLLGGAADEGPQPPGEVRRVPGDSGRTAHQPSSPARRA
jgi:hypothetical protein